MSKKCDRSSTNDPQTCKSNRQSSPAVHPKWRETMPESPQASVCLSSGRKTARHRTEKHHQHSSLLFDRARKTSKTVCNEMPRSSSKIIKTIQQVCEGQTHAREVRPVVGQRRLRRDFRSQQQSNPAVQPRWRGIVAESPQASACLSFGRKNRPTLRGKVTTPRFLRAEKQKSGQPPTIRIARPMEHASGVASHRRGGE